MLKARQTIGRRCVGWLVSIVAMMTSVAVSGEDLVISDHAIVNTGHHIYMRACAVCHGRDADGNGPYAKMLVAPPPALTTLSKANGGRFPFERIMEIVSGNELMPAHGARDMPVWGQEFSGEAESLGMDARTLARGRLLEVMAYLEFVQEK